MKFWYIVPLLVILVGVQIAGSFLALPSAVPIEPAFGNPEDVGNAFEYVVIIIVVTAVILLLLKLKIKSPIKVLFLLGVWASVFFVMANIVYKINPAEYMAEASIVVWLISITAVVLMWKYPEWYVIDIIGFIMCAAVSAILGVSFGLLPTIVLLVVLAIYDAISVYKTKHMQTLAEGVLSEKIPALFIIPASVQYSYIGSGDSDWKDIDNVDERPSHILGMGDIVFPSILVVSANTFITNTSFKILGLFTIPAIGAMIGSCIGMFVLLKFAETHRTSHAGLPFLNSFTIVGFLIAYALTGGITW